MVCLIDNYDSFSYNLYQLTAAAYAGLYGAQEGAQPVRVVRNDAVTVDELEALAPEALVLSPGPGRPADAGICEEAILRFSGKIPILGVCLGHQAICEAFGGVVGYASQVMHGKSSLALLDGASQVFAGIKIPTQVARYHSLAAEKSSLPECLRVTATSEDGEVMAVQHVEHPTFGLQFHPESILTTEGEAMMRNFLALIE